MKIKLQSRHRLLKTEPVNRHKHEHLLTWQHVDLFAYELWSEWCMDGSLVQMFKKRGKKHGQMLSMNMVNLQTSQVKKKLFIRHWIICNTFYQIVPGLNLKN